MSDTAEQCADPVQAISLVLLTLWVADPVQHYLAATKLRGGGFRRSGRTRGNSKLDEHQVRTIRAEYEADRSRDRLVELGRTYGVEATTIYRVVKRQTWQHIE